MVIISVDIMPSIYARRLALPLQKKTEKCKNIKVEHQGKSINHDAQPVGVIS